MEDEILKNHHFVLVHGFCLGSWCWYKLVSLLKLNGHKATALDLGGCGINPKQLDEISFISDYVQPLIDFMANLRNDEKVILVGHSFGGIPISLAMEKFNKKISLAVFITAYMPNWKDPIATLIQEYFKRGSIESFMDCKFTFDPDNESLPTSAMFGTDYMEAKLYQNCPLEDLELGKMLVRPNKFFLEDLGKKDLLTEDRYGTIKRCYIICEDDQVMEEEFEKYNVETSPPDEVIALPKSGHMVMLSKTQELCLCLQKLAKKYD